MRQKSYNPIRSLDLHQGATPTLALATLHHLCDPAKPGRIGRRIERCRAMNTSGARGWSRWSTECSGTWNRQPTMRRTWRCSRTYETASTGPLARNSGWRCGRTVGRRAAFHPTIEQPDVSAVMSFCSSEYHVDALRGETRRLFVEVLVVGGTIAGESQFP